MAQLYEVDLVTFFRAQTCLNRWNYISGIVPTGVLGAFGLLTALGFIPDPTTHAFPDTTMAHYIQSNVSTDVAFSQISIKAIYDVADFYDAGFAGGTAGQVSGESLSPINSIGFVSSRVVQNIRRGTKRLVGVSESQVQSGGILTDAARTAMQVVADSMGAVLTYEGDGGDVTYTPCVVSKQEYTTPSGKKAYQYYPTLTEQLTHIAQGVKWVSYAEVRSQVSRQYRRGR